MFEELFSSDSEGEAEPPGFAATLAAVKAPWPAPPKQLAASDAEIAALAAPASAFAAAVAAAAADAADGLPARVALAGASPRARAVAAALRLRGFDALAVDADDPSSSPVKPGAPLLLRAAARHAFVAVQAPSVRWSEAALVVDPFFREAFALARAPAQHTALLAALPRVFVGQPQRLARLLQRLAPRLDAAYEAARLTRPPWRSLNALLARWRLVGEEEEEVKAHEAALARANDAAAAAVIHAALRRAADAPRRPPPLVRVHAYDG